MTGRHAKTKAQNERETELHKKRDMTERDKLAFRQVDERQFIHRQIKQVRQDHAEQVAELHRDIAGFDRAASTPPNVKEQQATREPARTRTRKRTQGREPDFER